MKKLFLTVILVSALSATACVKSLNAFYEMKDVYFDRSLVGAWAAANGKETWTVVPDENETFYVIEETDEEERKSRFEARIFKIGDHSFLDLVAVPAGDYINADGFFDQTIPIHSLMAIKKEGCSARMSYLDPSWLKVFLAKNPSAVKQADAHGVLVLTDSTENLQAFVKKHLSTPGAFEKTETLYKKGKTQCEEKN